MRPIGCSLRTTTHSGEVEEAFVTFEKATVSRGSGSVRIGSAKDGIVIRSEGLSGRFTVERLEEAARKEGKGNQVITRIAFTPDKLAQQMTVRFRIS